MRIFWLWITVFCSLTMPTAQASERIAASTSTIEFPSEILEIPLGISTTELLKRRPRAYPVGSDPEIREPRAVIPDHPFTEELRGDPEGEVMYGFLEGTLSTISISWILPKERSPEARASFLAACDQIWGPKRKFAVFEQAVKGKTDRLAAYRWQGNDERRSLAFIQFSGIALVVGKADARNIKKGPRETKLVGKEARRVLRELGLEPTGR